MFKNFVIFLSVFGLLNAQYNEEFIKVDHNELVHVLPLDDDTFQFIELDKKINFYSEGYNHIYINTNGILTFTTELTDFLNQPFPLEYPSIAPFYANVDTSGGNESTAITFFKTQNKELLDKSSDLIKHSFLDHYDFEATDLYVATWENVGYYRAQKDKLNTFQVVLICSEDETYVKFVYPANGINWLRGEVGDLGLPDIRAQAGFMSEDGRSFTLEGSGTEKVQFLSSSSNINTPGVWLYRVGTLDYTSDIQEPNNPAIKASMQVPRNCAEGLWRKCHSEAKCMDTSEGFCCKCNEGFYGNGETCIDTSTPIRVTGSISGEINGEQLSNDVKVQSYVALLEGRSYSTINPINPSLGNLLKEALPIMGATAWMFAKPAKHSSSYGNGFQLSGGKLNHFSVLRFSESGDVFKVNQTFKGLNIWDQLCVDIVVSGTLPENVFGRKIYMNDYTESYMHIEPNTIVSNDRRQFELREEGRSIEFQLDQTIKYEKCDFSQFQNISVYQKVSKVSMNYLPNEKAIRSNIVAKISDNPEGELHPCQDGSATCGFNSVCLPATDETYDCVCKNGFEFENRNSSDSDCIDIDECLTALNICDEHAICHNTDGGYECICSPGYNGSGYKCDPEQPQGYSVEAYTVNYEEEEERRKYEENMRIADEERRRYEEEDRRNMERDEEIRRQYEEERRNQYISYTEQTNEGYSEYNTNYNHNEETYTYNKDPQEYTPYGHENDHDMGSQGNTIESRSECELCSINAECINDRCECRQGFSGDGRTCNRHCTSYEIFIGDSCVAAKVEAECSNVDEEENDSEGNARCTCPEGYEFEEDEDMCTYIIDDGDIAQVPCDVENNCHANATCEWNDHHLTHICTCVRGFEGDGYTCYKIEDSCTTNRGLCDTHASCVYEPSIGKSDCQCDPGYVGDGFRCSIAPECSHNSHCAENSYCDNGICSCLEGYERDISHFCVQSGSCGGTHCAENAICKWDNIQGVQYCDCLEGFSGDPLISCRTIIPSCHERNNCGLHASCEQSMHEYGAYECVCDQGYNGDGYVCIAERNCRNTPSLCDRNAHCFPVGSGLKCVCDAGYIGNGTVCQEMPRQESGFFLISQGPAIIKSQFGRQNHGTVIAVSAMIIGLDKDCVEGRVYWGDLFTHQIMSSKYDGSDSRPFITEDIQVPEGIAIDHISRRLYWTDSSKNTIEVASLDDPKLRAVLVSKNLKNPRGIAVDPYLSKLYWSDWNRDEPKIEMSNLDGTERKVLASKPEVKLPNSIVVVPNTSDICFVDADTHRIDCIDVFTKLIRNVADNVKYPFGLTFNQDNFYWTDWETKQVETVDLNGKRGRSIHTPFYGSQKMYSIVAVSDYCPITPSKCQANNGGCTDNRICLMNPLAPSGISCKCTATSTMCKKNDYNSGNNYFY